MDIDQLITAARPTDQPDAQATARHRMQLDRALAPPRLTTSDSRPATREYPHPASRLTRWTADGSRRVAMLGAAAAAVTVVALATTWLRSDERSVDALVVDAADATADALAGSGRAQVTTSDGSGSDASSYVFDGEDSATKVGNRETSRTVNGTFYVHTADYCPDRGVQWWRDDHQLVDQLPDLAGLLTVLSPAADFGVVGDDVVDGVPTTHLRAGSPQAVPDDAYAAILGSLAPGEVRAVTSLDVWVDESDVMRRIDTTFDFGDAAHDRFEQSVVFTNLGEPVRIEVPATYSVLPGDLAVDPCSVEPTHG